MILKPQNRNKRIPAEGSYRATLKSVTYLPSEADPKRVAFEFQLRDYDESVTKDVPISFEPGAILVKDVESLRGAAFTTAEIQVGVDPATFVGTVVDLVVVSKIGPGGKPKFIAGPFTRHNE
jgi:hypothetical protein